MRHKGETKMKEQRLFLRLWKDLFEYKEMSLLSMAIYSQISEFEINKKECFISDEQLAEQFHCSTKTISREINKMVECGYIVKETVNTQNGRKRVMRTKPMDKMSVADEDEDNQRTKCPLRNGQNDFSATDKMSPRNGQNDSIKDNIKNNIKDKKEKIREDSPEKNSTNEVEITKEEFKKRFLAEIEVGKINSDEITQNKSRIVIEGIKYYIVDWKKG